MKRLVITGLPCPPETWEKFLGKHRNQRILPFYEVLENSPSSDLRAMSRYVTAQIESFRPSSIIAHDIGVPLTLLSLLRLSKRKVKLSPRVTLFNGAFRKVDLRKANHPIRVQFMSSKKAVREAESKGGTVDLRLKEHLPKIRAMYRYIILYRLAERVNSLLGIDELLGAPQKLPFRHHVQMIVSRNDPYIPYEALEQLREDCGAERVVELDYGHFPYTLPAEKVVPLIEEFEARSH